MRTVAYSIIAVACTTLFVSCKKDVTKPEDTAIEVVETDMGRDLAIADPESETIEDADATYMYVIASTGLSLREYDNLKSEKLAIMPYGTKVKVLFPEDKNTMTVSGIPGGMDEIEFNHKKGYAFNGYLSKYFPPEKDITPKGYSLDLKDTFPAVTFTETTGGTVSSPSNTQTLKLPNAEWHEAFFIAQRLFDVPGEFTFPNPKGKQSQVEQDSKPKKGVWVSELQITREDNELQKIEYVYKSEKFDSNVVVTVENGVATIAKTEVVK